MTKAELNDPLWRLRNLYWIADKSGNAVLFRPNEAQSRFVANMANRNLILKARQLGFSTLIQLIILDQCIFIPNVHAGVIAQDIEAAGKIFDDKIKFAWDRMPDWVKQIRKAVGDSANELRFDNDSYIRVATSMRSSTLQYLHISEFGKICAKYPDKAKEIITGSLPALGNDGMAFIESTAEGREGKFFDLVQEALARERAGRKLGPKDFRLHFFSWLDCADYTQDVPESISEDDAEYFDGLQADHRIEIPQERRWWYCATKRAIFAGDAHLMRQEYPTTPEEAFEKSMEGCFYANQIIALRRANRVCSTPYRPGIAVDTAWDIGRSDGTAVWLSQRVDSNFHIIDFIEDWEKDYDIYVAEIQRRGWVMGRHFIPHDSTQVRQAATKALAISAKKALEDLGLRNLVVVPRTPTKMLAIQQVRKILPQCIFDTNPNVAKGLEHLNSYHKQWSTSDACFTDTPEHDIHSEAADAFAQLAQGWAAPTKKISVESLKLYDTNPFTGSGFGGNFPAF